MFLYMFIPKLEKPYQLINFLFQINSEKYSKMRLQRKGGQFIYSEFFSDFTFCLQLKIIYKTSKNTKNMGNIQKSLMNFIIK